MTKREKMLSVLAYAALWPGEYTLTDICRQTGLPRLDVLFQLNRLSAAGYLERGLPFRATESGSSYFHAAR